jgi:hypothetical protein
MPSSGQKHNPAYSFPSALNKINIEFYCETKKQQWVGLVPNHGVYSQGAFFFSDGDSLSYS